MNTLSVVAVAVAFATATLRAQNFLGLAYNVETSAASRGALLLAAGETMTRIDGSEIAGWGAETAGHRTLHALACIVQDTDATTPQTFDIALYPEDAQKPGFPDLTQRVWFAALVPGPSGTGGISVLRVVTPPAPVAVPIQGGGDVFVSFVLPAATATDALSMQVVLGYSAPGFTRWDTPNATQGATPPPAGTPANSHFVTRLGSALTYAQRRQHWLDVAHSGSSGVGLAITNQANYPTSNDPSPPGWGPAPGTADFESGSFPDVRGDNTGRRDDVAMSFQRPGFGNTGVVVFLLDQDFSAAFGPELPVAQFFAGASGHTCLVNPDIVAFVVTNLNRAWWVTPIPANVRPLLVGAVAKQQAVGIDLAGNFHASACDAMRF